MHFASPLTWWVAVLAAAAVTGLAFFSYRRPIVPLSAGRRALLVGLRALSLAAVVLLLCRPVILVPPAVPRDVVVPILVDVSRSMRRGRRGQTRIARRPTSCSASAAELPPPFKPKCSASERR
jgi:hypothetical protein